MGAPRRRPGGHVSAARAWLALTAAAGITGVFLLSDRLTGTSPTAAGLASTPLSTIAKVSPSAPADEPKADADGLWTVDPRKLVLRSEVGLVWDEREQRALYARRADEPRPIASLTKLMTALVIVDAGLPLDELIEITPADHDRLRGSRSRLRYGMRLTRLELLQVAIGASDNRAAAALARAYPGGHDALVSTMNERTWKLGMVYTRFTDPTGLDSENVSTAADLARLARALDAYPLIGALSTAGEFRVTDARSGEVLAFYNTNYLVRHAAWNITLSKTGYLAAAGNCLLLRATIEEHPVTIVLLNSWGSLSKFGDANRIRQWLLTATADGFRRPAP